MHIRFLLSFLLLSLCVVAQPPLSNPGSNHGNRFEQLGYLLQSPNEYRTASGAPGVKYWQQRADYDISGELDEANLRFTGSETITYYNNAPDVLSYLWLQLDGNYQDASADVMFTNRSRMNATMTNGQLKNLEPWRAAKEQDLGIRITKLTDATGKALNYTINKTMLRIDLPIALKAGQKFIFKVEWNYKIPNRGADGGRSGYEIVGDDENKVFCMTQWYPRMAVYSDFQGWQHLQFTGGAEFALTFGNFNMKLTVPSDFIVSSTGECTNYKQLLTPAQFDRWTKAQNATDVVEVVNLDEAIANEKDKSTDKKTWNYTAENVRDVAWATSRKFIWDAMPTYVNGKKIMAMSYYPKEAYNLWRKYSTKVVAHTLNVYSKHTIPYSYPVAISVEGSQGMEYPMLAINFGRCEKDGTYSEATKYGMIGVTIHEVGHNFFPMIVNSDERQYWWMDEGLNTFTQFLTEQEFDNNYPSRRGPAHLITDYMKLPKDQLEPIMTMGDNVVNVGANAYAKAATGLNILRETIMGRELFDFAFREYARRWAYKHPTPADLFRTMEDASGVDLDWFWRGWYYGTDPVDISLDDVKWFKMNNASNASALQQQPFEQIGKKRNKDNKQINFATDVDTSLRDFYYYNRGADAIYTQKQNEATAIANTDKENAETWATKNFYELTFNNKGGMVMPVIVEWTFKDGTKEVDRIPAGIWKLNEKQVTKVFIKDKEVASIRLDPMRETADIDESNGLWPLKELPSKFELFRQGQGGGARGQSGGGNSMQRAQKAPDKNPQQKQ